MLAKIISVCCAKDIATWRETAQRLPQCIDALKYEIIVPDSEVSLFKRESPPIFSVVPESTYLGERDLTWLQESMPLALRQRAGWYLQQFIKIEACRSAGLDVNCLIWDADTVPLKKLYFEDDEHRLLYYKGNHRPLIHAPYFDLIHAVLGLQRLVDESFISQCFPLRSVWVDNMCQAIELRHSSDSWMDVIVAHIDHNRGGSGFSEYEMLGTFFMHNYRDQMVFHDRQFMRHGSSLVGEPTQLSEAKWGRLAEVFDYIAFEVYETGQYRGLHVGCGNTRVERTFRGNLMLNSDMFRFDQTDMLFDASKLWPFPDAHFEHIVANNILEHVDDLVAVVSEMDRCLQPGGIIQLEVPFIGSYNHGTDVTHRRGLTFDSFNFLLNDGRNYLFREPNQRRFNYQLVSFFRENTVDGTLVRESLPAIPPRGSYSDWLKKVYSFEVPGTFGYVWQKLA